ncbi:multidrug resistance efflux pump [Scopulibacillus daqui]|uniref:Multidrug resistance efflux pump n=1 Tax=Scopulibacillus daqui TaxID=1469162 RepID=A0ABS2PW57_9BACL|nr:efflux RND transporter periplasmic adaptor subunit [Scopulibacillus daqui]MBM7644198.1 multidrug resistance efflux pump [Scopulibacillus daqui]
MSSLARGIIINIIVIIVLIGGGAIGYYYYDQAANYVKTDNATIDGQSVPIAAPTSGKLTKWDGQVGNTFDADEKVGEVEAQGPDGKTQKLPITMPEHSTIVQNKVVKNSFVGAGTPIATAYDLSDLYVTANIDETDIDNVKKDQKVDIYVDAYPDTKFTGRVEQIGKTTASTFSMMPQSNADGNYQKVTQVVPVKISIDNYKGVSLKPGMNVTVKVHI